MSTKSTPKKTKRSASPEPTASTSRAFEVRKESNDDADDDDNETPLPLLQMDDDIESELPIRGRPSKKLLLQKQQQRSLFNVKLQPEIKTVAAVAAAMSTGRTKPKRTQYKKRGINASLSTSQKSNSETYVMRLFERSLDLSKYQERTPLYPICRAWMANQPRNPNVAVFNSDDTASSMKREDNAEEVLQKLKSGEMKVLQQMPLPRKTDLPLIPPRLPAPKEEDKDKLKDASREDLLAANKAHWKNVRDNWQQHTKKYRKERYEMIDRIMYIITQPKRNA